MNEALSSWVPPSVLVGVLMALLAVAYSKLDKLLERIVSRLEAIERRMHDYATIEQLGRLGDRLDGRTTNNSERIAVLEALRKT